MTNYLASKADKEEVMSSLAKGDTDGWTTVSRRSVRGRPANTTDENSTVKQIASEEKLLDTNQCVKTQHKYDGTFKHGSSHVKILKRNSTTGSNVIKPAPHHEEVRKRDDNLPQKTAGILRIPDIHMLVDEGTKRWKEFNTAKEIWPSIDAKEDENGTTHRSIKSYSSILRATPQLNIPVLTTDNKVDSRSESEEEQVGSEVQKKKKKAKKKKKKSSSEEERRTDKPVTINFGSILDMQQSSFKSNQSETTTTTSNRSNTTASTTKTVPKKVLLTSTPLVPSLSTNKPLGKGKAMVTHMPHNILDSTAPLIKRGKERETPAKKRPSALKKVILKEREEKKRQRELGEPILDNVVGQLNNMSMADGAHDEEATQVSSGSYDPQNHHQQQQLSEEDVNEFSLQAILPSQKPKQLHNRKFREYCDHMLSPEIDNCVINLLSDLHRFQARAYLKDPIKARAKRRYVLGLREVTKHLRLKRIKCVIASPNMERIQSTGGIDEMLMHIIQLCNDYNITMVYALNRKKMGGILRKKVPVSIVGVFSYDGAEQHYKKMVQLVSEKRELYRDKLQLLLQSVTTVPPDDDTVQQEAEEDVDSPCDDDTPCDDDDEPIGECLYDDDDSWDQSMLHESDIIQGSYDPLQTGYYYIPTAYYQSYTHLNIDAPEFVPSWRYS